MANHNDFKVLQSKCLKMYHFLGVTGAESLTDIKRSRLGFYHFVLENITGVTDVELIKNMIFDAEYNSIVCSIKLDDLGIDAVNIIEHDGINKIQLFNFKYREKFVIKEKTENDISRSTKFLEYMLAESLPKGLNRKIRSVLENIRKRLDSTTVYDLELFMVSNEEGGIASSSEPYVDILKRNYDMRIINISLSELAGFLYANNRNAKASFIVSVKDFLTFDRDELSSKTSYIVKLPLVDLVRILCTDQELSCKHDIADDSEILNVQLNHSLLHDNVRGYLGETNYNRNIITSLKTQQSDFFMYNNGVTIVTNRVFAESKNSGKKYFFNIEDFQVVNGGQTIKSIFKFLSEINTSTTDQKLREIFVLVRIFNIENDELKNNIAEYTNSQNAISSSDLKSVDNIQIQIESYLKLNSILYVRKAGSLGDDSTTYEYRISKDKLAQIIHSEQGYPDRVTNQKQKLFSDYYKQIFPEVFDFDKMLSLINLFRNIEETLQKESKDYTDLRAYYILYIIGKVQCSIDEANDILNQAVSKQRQTKKASSISVPRLMIQKSFREQVAELMGNESINEGTTCDPLSAI